MAKKHHFMRYGVITLCALLVGVALYTFWAPVATTVASGYGRLQDIRTRYNPPAPVVAKKQTTETTNAATTEDGRAGFEKTTKVFIDPVAEMERMKQQLADAKESAKAFASEQTKALSEQLASLKAEIAKAKEPAPAAAPAPVASPVVVPQQQSALPAPAARERVAASPGIITPDNASARDIALMAEAYRVNGKVPGGQKLGGFAEIPRNQGFTCPDGTPGKLVNSRNAKSGRLIRRWACHN